MRCWGWSRNRRQGWRRRERRRRGWAQSRNRYQGWRRCGRRRRGWRGRGSKRWSWNRCQLCPIGGNRKYDRQYPRQQQKLGQYPHQQQKLHPSNAPPIPHTYVLPNWYAPCSAPGPPSHIVKPYGNILLYMPAIHSAKPRLCHLLLPHTHWLALSSVHAYRLFSNPLCNRVRLLAGAVTKYDESCPKLVEGSDLFSHISTKSGSF